MKFFSRLSLLFILFTSCEKTLDLQPKGLPPLLVVDGNIETGQPPIIFLSNSVNYFSTISPQILNESQVKNAVVVISDGVKTNQLKLYTTNLGNGYMLYYYSIDSSNLLKAIKGENGKTYGLNIMVDGKTFTSSTTIPLLKKQVDSIWWRKPFAEKDSLKAVLMAKVTDPAGYGNYIRYFTKVNNDRFLPGANSVFDDQVVDGQTYDIQVDQGINRNDPPKFEDYGYFERGDTVTVKFSNIDKSTYDFWRTLEYSYQSIGNPFSSPTNILSNVKGGLGAFCGYAVQYKTVIIPK